VSAAAKKRTTIDTNNTNTVKAALSKRTYLHRTLKGDSHTACRAYDARIPFPCHAAPLRV